MSTEEWIDPALDQDESAEAYAAMQAAESAKEAEAIYDLYGQG